MPTVCWDALLAHDVGVSCTLDPQVDVLQHRGEQIKAADSRASILQHQVERLQQDLAQATKEVATLKVTSTVLMYHHLPAPLVLGQHTCRSCMQEKLPAQLQALHVVCPANSRNACRAQAKHASHVSPCPCMLAGSQHWPSSAP
jgi:hypothetical protein